MHQCLNFILFWNNSIYFGRSIRPSSVHDCTYASCCMYSRELLMMDGKTVRNIPK